MFWLRGVINPDDTNSPRRRRSSLYNLPDDKTNSSPNPIPVDQTPSPENRASSSSSSSPSSLSPPSQDSLPMNERDKREAALRTSHEPPVEPPVSPPVEPPSPSRPPSPRLLGRIIRTVYGILRMCCFWCTLIHGVDNAIEDNEQFYDDINNHRRRRPIPSSSELVTNNTKMFRAWFNRRGRYTKITLISLVSFLCFYALRSSLGLSVFLKTVKTSLSPLMTLVVIVLSSLIVAPLITATSLILYAFWNILNTYWCRKAAAKCCCDLPSCCLPPCCCSVPRFFCRKCCCCV